MPSGIGLDSIVKFVYQSPIGFIPTPVTITRNKNLADNLIKYFEKF